MPVTLYKQPDRGGLSGNIWRAMRAIWCACARSICMPKLECPECERTCLHAHDFMQDLSRTHKLTHRTLTPSSVVTREASAVLGQSGGTRFHVPEAKGLHL
eukprot:1154126-Pelagomonas_calceolata.AAC.1